MNASRRDPSRRITGFSLLEVLLALALGVILLTAIGAAVDQSWRLSTQGKTELQRQQIARAVSRMIERDIRSVMFTPPSEFAEEEGTTTTGTTSTNSASASSSSNNGSTGNSSTGAKSANSSSTGAGGSGSTDSAEEDSSTSIVMSSDDGALVLASRGIRGDQYTLEIDGSRPQRSLSFQATPDGGLPAHVASDLRTIMYLLAPPGVAADPQGRGGLARREGDRYAIVSAEAQGDNPTGSFQTTLLAHEIISIEFRYFDGTTWQMMWDSVSFGRLPRAIEMQIRFAPPSSGQATWLNQAVNRSTETARVVISVPAADPLPEEMLP